MLWRFLSHEAHFMADVSLRLSSRVHIYYISLFSFLLIHELVVVFKLGLIRGEGIEVAT